GLLDALGAPGPLVVDEPLLFAAIQVRAQVDQRVDHLLASLREPADRESRRDVVGEDREHALLHGGVTAWTCDAERADRLAGCTQGLRAGRPDGGRRRAAHAAP